MFLFSYNLYLEIVPLRRRKALKNSIILRMKLESFDTVKCMNFQQFMALKTEIWFLVSELLLKNLLIFPFYYLLKVMLVVSFNNKRCN